jgi:hypothetical protein
LGQGGRRDAAVGAPPLRAIGELSPARDREEVRFKVHVNGVFHEGDDGDARSGTPTPPAEQNVPLPYKIVEETPELPQVSN